MRSTNALAGRPRLNPAHPIKRNTRFARGSPAPSRERVLQMNLRDPATAVDHLLECCQPKFLRVFPIRSRFLHTSSTRRGRSIVSPGADAWATARRRNRRLPTAIQQRRHGSRSPRNAAIQYLNRWQTGPARRGTTLQYLRATVGPGIPADPPLICSRVVTTIRFHICFRKSS